jgi:hypothetical protein
MLGRGKVRAFVDEPFDGMLRRDRSDPLQCHRPVGSANECDGLEDPPFPAQLAKPFISLQNFPDSWRYPSASNLKHGCFGRISVKTSPARLQGVASAAALLPL